FPAIKLGPGAGGREHLGPVARVLRVLGELEERDRALPIEDRNGDAATVPAEQMKVDQDVGNSPLMEVVPDPRRQGFVEVCRLGEKWWVLVHVRSVAQSRRNAKTTQVYGGVTIQRCHID